MFNFNYLILLILLLALPVQSEDIALDVQENIESELLTTELRTVKLVPKIRREILADAPIPTVPLHILQPFLVRARVITLEDFEAAPRVIAFTQEHIVGGTGDEFYVDNIDVSVTNINSFDVLRLGQVYTDPDSGENLGYEAIRVGTAIVLKPGDTPKLLLKNTNREIQLDDRLLPTEEDDLAIDFVPTPALSMIEAKIIAVLNGISEIGIYSVVALNKGAEDGLIYGNTMQILQTPFSPCRGTLNLEVHTYSPISCDEKFNLSKHIPFNLNTNENDKELPLEIIGKLMIFKVFSRISYAIVLHATNVIHIGNEVRGGNG